MITHKKIISKYIVHGHFSISTTSLIEVFSVIRQKVEHPDKVLSRIRIIKPILHVCPYHSHMSRQYNTSAYIQL